MAEVMFKTRRRKPLSEINRLTLERGRLLVLKQSYPDRSAKAQAIIGQVATINLKLLKFEGQKHGNQQENN